jgi:hypothetical protein
LTLIVEDLFLEQLARWMPGWLGGARGEVGGVLVLEGTAESPRMTLDMEALDLHWGDIVREVSLRAVGQAQGSKMVMTGSVTHAGDLVATLDAAVPVDVRFASPGLLVDQDARFDLWFAPGDLARVNRVTPLVPEVPGTGSARLSASGPLRRPRIEVGFVSEVPVTGLRDPLRLEGRVVREGSGVTWRAAVREGLLLRADLRGGGTTELDTIADWALAGGPEPDWGAPDLFIGGLRGGLAFKGVPVKGLAEVAGLPLDVQGGLWGKLELGGDLMRPVPTLDLSIQQGRLGSMTMQNARVVASPGVDGLDLAMNVDLVEPKVLGEARGRRAPEEVSTNVGNLYAGGSIPLKLDLTKVPEQWAVGKVHLDIDSDIPVRVLSALDKGVLEADGAVEVRGVVEGSVWDPDVFLTARSSPGAGFVYRPLGVRVRDLEISGKVDPAGISLDRLFFRTDPMAGGLVDFGEDLFGLGETTPRKRNKGQTNSDLGRSTVSVRGRAELAEWLVQDLALEANLDRALLFNQGDQTLRVSTTDPLRVSGDLALPVITGRARVENATFFLDYATTVGGGASRVDPRIVIHRGGQSTASRVEEAWFVDDVAIDVGVDLGRATAGRLTMPVESLAWLGEVATTLTRMDLRARLGGTVRYRQLPCRGRAPDGTLVHIRTVGCGLVNPQVEGVVSILEGSARVLNADFALEDSEISFVGNEVYNPNLDVRGTMVAAGGESIDMNVGGTAYNPDITFTSADTDQIFTTLLLGRADAGTQGLSQALAMVGVQSLLSGINVGSINVDPSGSVVWGMTVARNLYAEVTLGGTPRPDRNVAELEVELSLTEGALGRVGFGAYAIPFWADLLLERKFDAPRAADRPDAPGQ